MASLPSANVDELWVQFMKALSRVKRPIPVTNDKIRGFIVDVDAALEQAELDVVAGLPAGDIKDWLIANQDIGREIMLRVEQKRKEVL